ncbi:hypothetical protein [Shinella sp. BYT-45]|uniref:hypothetical protein n=1 Tax=Shinella sp. BYT-45 TaxID=3377377 RepID=UPI00397FE02E
MKTRTVLALLAVLMSASAGQAQVFKDLPGVVPSDATEEYSGRDAVVCEQRVHVPRSSNSRWMPRNIYVCERNGITTSSTRLPPSSERALRGLDW